MYEDTNKKNVEIELLKSNNNNSSNDNPNEKKNTDRTSLSRASSHTTNNSDDKRKKIDKIPPASTRDLFRFATTNDILVFSLGVLMCLASAATFPAINIIFGDIIDAVAQPINVKELVSTAAIAMVALSTYGFFTFFISFFCCGVAASKIANEYRTHFLDAVLRQDAVFFDTVDTATLSLMLSESAMDIQSGLSDKFASAVQGAFQLVFGFGIAFYFGPYLTLVLLACMPVMIGLMTAMVTWGAEDGLYGKEEYEKAASIPAETLSNMRTVASLNAEIKMSAKYDSKLGSCEKAAIRQGTRAAILSGSFFFIMFVLYGLGFWYGAKLIADSTDHAIKTYPPPHELLHPYEWPGHYAILSLACNDYKCDVDDDAVGFAVGDCPAFEICACGIPWNSLGMISPKCGCGFEDMNFNTEGGGANGNKFVFSVLSGCFSGGTTIMVFFSILMGGFGAGQIGPGLKAFSDARMAAAKILQVIERTPDIDITKVDNKIRLDTHTNTSSTTKSGDAGGGRVHVKGEIVFENIDFGYNHKKTNNAKAVTDDDCNTKKGDNSDEVTVTEERMVFRGCNLTIKAGETVALVGESGCGKSTIAKLVQRFYDPTNGRVLLDGMDLREIALIDLRANIGVVSQEPLLFDTSIKENIKYGKLDNTTEEDIINAAKNANAHEFIMSFPDGYDTLVGPGGCKLSGGQKQRIAIARAILRNPPILILDEATSALDTKSEKIVQAALDKIVLKKNNTQQSRTTIVIAHRLSTVRNADKIIVLGSPVGTSTAVTGSVVLEQGCHDELMAKDKGYYKALIGAGEGLGQRRSDRLESKSDSIAEKTISALSSSFLSEEDSNLNYSIDNTENIANSNIADALPVDSPKDASNKSFNLFDRFKNKKDPKELAKLEQEKKEMKAHKSRVWGYTKPEMPWIVFATLASAAKGTILPLLSIVFAEMIAVWYDSDTTRLREESLRWSFLFYGIAFASLILEVIQKSVFEMIGERLTRRLRSDLFRSMLRQDITWFEDEENSLGVLLSRLSTDVKLVRLVAGQSLASTLESAAALTTGIIIAAYASWEVFLIMLSMVPLLGVTEALQWVALKSSEGGIRGELSKSTDKLQETVHGIREVQSFSLEGIVAKDVASRINGTIIPASRKAAIMKGFMMGMIQLIQFSVYAFAFWFGGEMIHRGRIDFEAFNKALWAMAFAGSGLGAAAVFAGDAAKAASAVKSIFETLDHKPAIDSKPWENDGLMDIRTEKPKVRQLEGEDDDVPKGGGTANLNKVNFAYPTRKAAKVFDEIDLIIPAGKVVALVGSSGSGKSSVIQLLERFYDPVTYIEEKGEEKIDIVVHGGGKANPSSDGVVKINGKDLRESDCRFTRKHMGLVGQEPVLFNDTIYNNIALGKDGCTKLEVEEAAKRANAYDFIMKFEDGFDTNVGKGGNKVSGGQKQRIAIARALISDPRILLLDEATSALDNESEKIVQASLDALLKEKGGDRTTIIIAHRLSTIKEADMICVLENNGNGSKVCEIGTHEELMELGQKYKALVQAYGD